MEITLHLKPEIEARLISQSTAQGVSIKQLLEQMIEGFVIAPNQIEELVDESLTDEAWRATLNRFGKSPSLAKVPPLSDAAISRESIYSEREDRQL